MIALLIGFVTGVLLMRSLYTLVIFFCWLDIYGFRHTKRQKLGQFIRMFVMGLR